MPEKEYDMGACTVFFKSAGATSETELGYTSGGCTVKVSTETKEIEVDQLLEPVDEIITKRSITVSIPLASFTLENLQRAFPGSKIITDATVSTKKKLVISSISGRSAMNDVGELRLHPVTAASETDKSKDFLFLAAAPLTTSLEIQYTKDGLKTIPIEFKAYSSQATATKDITLIIGDPTATASE